MTIPGNLALEAPPYGPMPVVPLIGQQGGPYTVRGPAPVTILPSASRTVTTVSPITVNPGYRGIYIYFSVTVNPGGAQTLELQLTGSDPITGSPFVIMKAVATAAPGGIFLLYPGLAGAAVEGVALTRNLLLPGSYYVGIVHSAAGAWTYSVTGVLLP